jgi:hypothetical protein
MIMGKNRVVPKTTKGSNKKVIFVETYKINAMSKISIVQKCNFDDLNKFSSSFLLHWISVSTHLFISYSRLANFQCFTYFHLLYRVPIVLTIDISTSFWNSCDFVIAKG